MIPCPVRAADVIQVERQEDPKGGLEVFRDWVLSCLQVSLSSYTPKEPKLSQGRLANKAQ